MTGGFPRGELREPDPLYFVDCLPVVPWSLLRFRGKWQARLESHIGEVAMGQPEGDHADHVHTIGRAAAELLDAPAGLGTRV